MNNLAKKVVSLNSDDFENYLKDKSEDDKKFIANSLKEEKCLAAVQIIIMIARNRGRCRSLAQIIKLLNQRIDYIESSIGAS